MKAQLMADEVAEVGNVPTDGFADNGIED